MAITSMNSLNHTSFTFDRVSDLENAEAKNRNFDAIVQFYSLHNFLFCVYG